MATFFIALSGVFHPIEDEKDIYTTGVLRNDDVQNLLVAARKAVEFGYKVYILPTPKGMRTPDFILEKKNTLTSDIKCYFETNKNASEVLIFKGGKRISIVRRHAANPAFYSVLKKLYE